MILEKGNQMFDFSKWWDDRCLQSYYFKWDADKQTYVEDYSHLKLLFISRPYPVYSKDNEADSGPWRPSNDWRFNGWVKGDGSKRYKVRFDTIDFDDYLNYGRKKHEQGR